MDKNRIVGSVHEAAGAAKEKIGKAIGDPKLQRDGKAEKGAGKLQDAIGVVADAVREVKSHP